MKIVDANDSHFKYAEIICDTIARVGQSTRHWDCKRTWIIQKNWHNGNALSPWMEINLQRFCYIEVWGWKICSQLRPYSYILITESGLGKQ